MRKLLSVLCLTVVLIQGVLMPANGQESDAAGKIWFEGAGDVQDVRTGGNQSGQAEAASQVNLSGQSGSQEQTERVRRIPGAGRMERIRPLPRVRLTGRVRPAPGARQKTRLRLRLPDRRTKRVRPNRRRRWIWG